MLKKVNGNQTSFNVVRSMVQHRGFNNVGRCSIGLKLKTHLAILYADRRDRRKSPGVPGAAIAIFADRRDRRIKSPISGMSDIGD